MSLHHESIAKIASDAGLPLDEISKQELEDLQNMRTGKLPESIQDENPNYLALSKLQEGLTNKYAGIYSGQSTKEKVRREIQLDQNLQTLFDLKPVDYSYGLFVDTYQEMMRAHKREGTGGRVLLTGALTGDTIREFNLTVRKMYPEAKTTAIDIEAAMVGDVATKDGIQFAQSDVFHLPFGDEFFEEVHANALLDQLIGGTNRIEENLTKVFISLYRVLVSGGSFLSIERVPFDLMDIEDIEGSKQKYIDLLKTISRRIGFSNFEIFPVKKQRSRKLMREYLLGRDSGLDTAEINDDEPRLIALCLTR